ncbi:MAG: helix-hairpin-helix domain-containing protein [Thermomicrobiales bacterium]
MMVRGVSLLSIAVAAIGGVMLTVMFFRDLDRREAPPIIIEDVAADATIVVAVEGAVASPGLVFLPSGSRWGDAIIASGGMVAGADTSYVNAAARLTDGERLVIPTEVVVATGGDQSPPFRVPASPSLVGEHAADQGRVNINRATASELDALPGIGPVLAERIVERRGEIGRFATVDELVAIRGISEGMLEELRPLVTT